MTTLQLLILCATVLAVVLVLAAVMHGGGGASVEFPNGTTIVVHTRDQRSLRGTVVRAPGHLALEDAVYLQGGTEQPVGGTVRIPAANVAWVQELG
jgi:hypothetical protein